MTRPAIEDERAAAWYDSATALRLVAREMRELTDAIPASEAARGGSAVLEGDSQPHGWMPTSWNAAPARITHEDLERTGEYPVP
ncbi:MAG: hypothetical protein FJ202_10435 [Gemmatimonadetes bacterium]|nr:hypothetical protein [Gemmatimonadota bacterium]